MSESERDELLRRKAELEERIAFLESEQHGGGLAAVKAEGARIVFEHEQRLAREPIRPLAPGEYLSPDPLAHLRPPRESQGESVTAVTPEPAQRVEPEKPKKKRGGGNDDVV